MQLVMVLEFPPFRQILLRQTRRIHQMLTFSVFCQKMLVSSIFKVVLVRTMAHIQGMMFHYHWPFPLPRLHVVVIHSFQVNECHYLMVT